VLTIRNQQVAGSSPAGGSMVSLAAAPLCASATIMHLNPSSTERQASLVAFDDRLELS